MLPLADTETLAAHKQDYLKLFPYRLSSLIKRPEATAWRSMSQFHWLTDEEILLSIEQKSILLRAISFDNKTSFAVISFPSTKVTDHKRLPSVLLGHGLRVKPYLASGREEVQLFVFFDRPVESDLVVASLTNVLTTEGFDLGEDSIRICPNASLSLPLQSGFAWLNDDLVITIERDQIPLESALALFLADVRKYVTPAAVLTSNIVEQGALETGAEQANTLLVDSKTVLLSSSLINQSSPTFQLIELVNQSPTKSDQSPGVRKRHKGKPRSRGRPRGENRAPPMARSVQSTSKCES